MSERNSITVGSTGNCNIGLISGLSNYNAKTGMLQALKDTFTNPVYNPNYYYGAYERNVSEKAPTYRNHQCGYLIFAQGSEDPVKTQPYAHNFKKLIEEHDLGTVVECPPAKNPLHNGKKGITFVWVLPPHAKRHAWWKEHVLEPWQQKNKKPKKEKKNG